MKYQIISATNPRALSTAVNEWLEQGWQPLGAPIAAKEDSFWSQAVVKGFELQVRGPRWEGGPR